jgi:hypothetical protein
VANTTTGCSVVGPANFTRSGRCQTTEGGEDQAVIFAILALVGVPLWLCTIGLLTLLLRNRGLRKRAGNVPVRTRRSGKKRWSPGHGVWVHDVFAFRGLPAAWREELVWASGATLRPATEEERKKLHRIGDEPIVASLRLIDGESIEFAARSEHQDELLGPFVNSPAVALSGTPQRSRNSI